MSLVIYGVNPFHCTSNICLKNDLSSHVNFQLFFLLFVTYLLPPQTHTAACHPDCAIGDCKFPDRCFYKADPKHFKKLIHDKSKWQWFLILNHDKPRHFIKCFLRDWKEGQIL